MPTPRAHGGAALVPINLTTPAFAGLNTEQQAAILGVEWATVLRNAVFDNAGRPAIRKGWQTQTTVAAASAIKRIFEYYQADETSEIISSADNDIYSGASTPTSIDGTLTITDGNIKFVNFNDLCIAFGIGTGGIPAQYNGTGTFGNITVNSGTAPTGRIGTSAFGRLWGVDADGKTIRYSALLDQTRWASADGGGLIDMSSVWPSGQDTVIAIEEFGGDLVVFGKNHTVIWTDGQGSSLGIDPTVMYVSDTIPGFGAVTQFAITRAAGDLWVLTPQGLTGLKRELTQKSTETTNISKNVQSQLLSLLDAEVDPNDVTLEYFPREDFVLLVFPSSDLVLHFDVQTPLQDGAFRVTTWRSEAGIQTVAHIRDIKSLYGALQTATGEIFKYTGFSDNGQSYSFVYESGWLDLGQEAATHLKFVKTLSSVVFVEASTSVVHTLEYDFGRRSYAFSKAAAGGLVAQFGISEFGANGSVDPGNSELTAGTDVSEFSGSISIRTLKVPAAGSGQYIKVGVLVDTNNAGFSLQQINLFAKIGRMAV